MAIFQDVALPMTIEDFLEGYDNAKKAIEEMHAINDRQKKACDALGRHLWNGYPFRDDKSRQLRELRQRFWRGAFDITDFARYMDDQARKEFDRSLENPPEFTMDNIRATFLELAQKADMMFNRGVVNIFKHLSDGYKTNSNEPFRLGRKFIMGWGCDNWRGRPNIRYQNEGRIDDIDRVCSTLLNKEWQPRRLASAINASFDECYQNGDRCVFDNDLFHIKGFKNGSLHWTVKSEKLLNKINDLIAAYYGDNTLAKSA